MPTAATPVNLPIVDFSYCATAGDLDLENSEVQQTTEEIVKGLQQYSGLYLINHGIKSEDLEALRSASRSFFDLPEERKQRCKRDLDHGLVYGWLAERMEVYSGYDDSKNVGLYQCFNVCFSTIDTFPWPDDDTVPGFRDANRHFMNEMNRLTMRLYEMLGRKLSPNDPDFFIRSHCKNLETSLNNTTIRNAVYPPLFKYTDEGNRGEQQRMPAHTDFATISFVLQDQAGGFEIRDTDGTWFEARPLKGGILLIVSDMLERWTAGSMKACMHRVVAPPGEKKNSARESTIYFSLPDNDIVVTCLDGSDKYPPLTMKELIQSKVRNE